MIPSIAARIGRDQENSGGNIFGGDAHTHAHSFVEMAYREKFKPLMFKAER